MRLDIYTFSGWCGIVSACLIAVTIAWVMS